MSKIDRYLLQSLRADAAAPDIATEAMIPLEEASEDLEGSALESMEEEGIVEAALEPGGIPLLIQVDDPLWSGEEVPGLIIVSRLRSVISARGTAESLEALRRDPAVLSVEASRPMEAPGELSTSIPLVNGDRVHAHHGERGDAALVGIVDGGIDVLHEAFRDAAGNTRIVAAWDQWDASGIPAVHPFGYGTLHMASDIDAYIAANAVPAGLGRDPSGHGTHVASIAAGRATGAFAGGMAPASRLVVVRSRQGRFENGQVASLGYSHNHLDALAWLRQVARDQGLPMAVNMSLGMNAGAHDGTSLLETGFDEFSSGGRSPGLVVVKSAGNEGNKSGHAELTLSTGGVNQVHWTARKRVRRQDLIEVWFRSGDEIELELENPSGERTPAVTVANDQVQGTFASGDHFDLDLERLHIDNGDTRVLVRVHRGGAAAVFETGRWKLHLRARAIHGAGRVHAWIERRRTRPVHFTSHVARELSLSIPGTARTTIAVGSVDPANPANLAASSSHGPTQDRREKPDVVAPGDGITAARGGTANGTISKPGTSMAAPHVTGALALLMSHWAKQQGQVDDWRQLDAAQMRAALINTSVGFSGQHDPGFGFGLLDVEALIDYF